MLLKADPTNFLKLIGVRPILLVFFALGVLVWSSKGVFKDCCDLKVFKELMNGGQLQTLYLPGTNSGHVGGVTADPRVGDDLGGGVQAARAGVDLVLGQGQVAQTLVPARGGRAWPRVPCTRTPQPLGGPDTGPGEGRDVGVLEK